MRKEHIKKGTQEIPGNIFLLIFSCDIHLFNIAIMEILSAKYDSNKQKSQEQISVTDMSIVSLCIIFITSELLRMLNQIILEISRQQTL